MISPILHFPHSTRQGATAELSNSSHHTNLLTGYTSDKHLQRAWIINKGHNQLVLKYNGDAA